LAELQYRQAQAKLASAHLSAWQLPVRQDRRAAAKPDRLEQAARASVAMPWEAEFISITRTWIWRRHSSPAIVQQADPALAAAAWVEPEAAAETAERAVTLWAASRHR